MINVTGRGSQLALPDSYSIEYTNRNPLLHCSVSVCLVSVPSLCVRTFVRLKADVTQTTLFFCVYMWPMDLTIVSPKESGREKEGPGASTVDYRGLVRVWCSHL